ncbi:MAG: hypothetical protein U9N49_11615 [Campylobacterota bacterium]|nr:hypothetical protein [Campylobacterota bacterium]
MQTIQLELEDSIYNSIQAKGINIKELFEEFIYNLNDSPSISLKEAKQRVHEAVSKYQSGTLETISHDDMWEQIEQDCEQKVANRV